jgi:hypothetical protein
MEPELDWALSLEKTPALTRMSREKKMLRKVGRMDGPPEKSLKFERGLLVKGSSDSSDRRQRLLVVSPQGKTT